MVGRGSRGNRSAEVIGCEPSATSVACLGLTPMPISVDFRNYRRGELGHSVKCASFPSHLLISQRFIKLLSVH